MSERRIVEIDGISMWVQVLWPAETFKCSYEKCARTFVVRDDVVIGEHEHFWTRGLRYCSLRCSRAAGVHAFTVRNPDYARECRRLEQRVRRGVLARADYAVWKATNTPESWEKLAA